MAGALLRIDDDFGQAAMDGALVFGARFLVDGRGEQWMRKADALALELDQVCLECGRETRADLSSQRILEQPDTGLGGRRDEAKRRLAIGREPGKAILNQLAEFAGNRQRPAGLDLRPALVESARKL